MRSGREGITPSRPAQGHQNNSSTKNAEENAIERRFVRKMGNTPRSGIKTNSPIPASFRTRDQRLKRCVAGSGSLVVCVRQFSEPVKIKRRFSLQREARHLAAPTRLQLVPKQPH